LLTLLRLPRGFRQLLSTLGALGNFFLLLEVVGVTSLKPLLEEVFLLLLIHDRNGSGLSLGGTCRTTADDIPRAFRVLSNRLRLIVMDWLSKDFRDNSVRGREWIAVQWMSCIAYGGVLL
jgi:hypothetical protein